MSLGGGPRRSVLPAQVATRVWRRGLNSVQTSGLQGGKKKGDQLKSELIPLDLEPEAWLVAIDSLESAQDSVEILTTQVAVAGNGLLDNGARAGQVVIVGQHGR